MASPTRPMLCVALTAGVGQGHQLTNWGNSSKNVLGGVSHLSNVNWQANRFGKLNTFLEHLSLK